MKKSLAIIGAGAWGSALAIALSDKFDRIFLITKDKANTDRLGNQHEVLSIPFNSKITIGSSFEAIEDSQAVLIATPSSSFNSVLKDLKPHIKGKPVAWVTKGFDPDNGKLLHESFSQKLPDHHPCVISGPTFAAEIVEKKPAAIVVASKDKTTRDFWAETIQTRNLRAYTNSDIVGVQVGTNTRTC